MEYKKVLGVIGVIGVGLTAGIALPLVNRIKLLSPEQLMIFRGLATALMALVCLRGRVGTLDKYTWLIGVTLPLATLGLFQGIRAWGAGPTIIVLTATPVINFLVSLKAGRKVTGKALIALFLVLGGVFVAHRGGHFQWRGLGWSVFATIMNGILYEWFARARASSLQKCFYGSIGMGLLGLALSDPMPWAGISHPSIITDLVVFVTFGGVLYWVANLVTFKNLPTMEASILVQIETPAVMIGALRMGETITPIQWLGVAISLFAAAYLMWYVESLSKDP